MSFLNRILAVFAGIFLLSGCYTIDSDQPILDVTDSITPLKLGLYKSYSRMDKNSPWTESEDPAIKLYLGGNSYWFYGSGESSKKYTYIRFIKLRGRFHVGEVSVEGEINREYFLAGISGINSSIVEIYDADAHCTKMPNDLLKYFGMHLEGMVKSCRAEDGAKLMEYFSHIAINGTAVSDIKFVLENK
jgi:hypothetical protein